MRLLLDTHAFIWWDREPARLLRAAYAACAEPANDLYLSVASIWELQIKIQLGKLALRAPLADVLADQQRNGLSVQAITIEDVLGLAALPAIHRDPFDRLLVAQARHGGFRLISHDPEVARYAVPILC